MKNLRINRRTFVSIVALLLTLTIQAQDSELNLLKESGAGKLYETNGFLVPVLTGSSKEMGEQYGTLMGDYLQKAWDIVVQPGVKAGAITDEVMEQVTQRAYSTASTRNKLFYEGVAEGSGWSLNKVCMLDQVMEFGIYQSKIHSFAGCTSIMSWGGHSTDGGMYTGRNMDWSEEFCKFPTVLTVRCPNDGSYKFATTGWPGMYCAFTAINEHGVYLDVHDGTSMGGSLVYFNRPSILNSLTDLMSESASFSALVSKLNGMQNSTSMILSVADENGAGSMECSSLGGNRLRSPEGESMAVVNTFLGDNWGLGKRETVSNSLRRYANMTDRLAENKGKVDAQVVRDIMDLRIFNPDGSFAENGGATKPAKQDADLTNYQMVCDVKNRQVWLKIPVPDYFADWTKIDLNKLWGDNE
ncbi:C45 family peptidase [Draconibacterium sp. IB214405]|uniref:C45 family peptidase n=1 Tax=Draconibacterium sp. IB214405 TaxID=3097352 RepID=UPI002A0F7126|nr:C45 family peptidase [Draconibacterium sp. IB214405]MDX8339040.1 C45 family peptidase [Draconibacterium sp. IB214405]